MWRCCILAKPLKFPLKLQFRRLASQLIPKDAPTCSTRPSIELRDYQKDCITRILESLKSIKKPAVSLPTGSGKTVIFSTLIPQIRAQAGQGNKTLVLVNRKEIAFQTVRTINSLIPELKVGLEMGTASYAAQPDVDVCVASIHTIHKSARLEAFDPREFKLVIVDEAHHTAAETYHRTLSHFGIEEKNPKIFCVGVSATFFRKDKKSLQIFDDIVYHREPEEMMKAGHLCNVQVSKYDFEVPEGFSTKKQDNNFLFSDTGRDLVVKIWQESGYKSTVVFCISKKHVEALTASFRSAGVDCRSLTGDDKPEYRNQVIEMFKNREFPVLLNCAILTEGTDIPCIDQIIFATPLGSPGLAMQMIGRGLRLYPGKDLCNTVLFTPMVTFDTSNGLLPQLRGLTNVKETEQFVGGSKSQGVPRSNLGLPDMDSSVDKIEESRSSSLGSAFGAAGSHATPFRAWTRFSGAFWLSLPQSTMTSTTMLKIERVKNEYKLFAIQKYPKTKPSQRGYKNREIYSATSAEDAFEKAETFLEQRFFHPLAHGFFNTRAKWRRDPPSQAQLNALKKFGLDRSLRALNKGQATTLMALKICAGVKLTDENVNKSLKLGLDLSSEQANEQANEVS